MVANSNDDDVPPVQTKSLNFVKRSNDPVPCPETKEDAAAVLPSFFEVGSLSGHSLTMLEQVVSHVYLPLPTTIGISNVVQVGESETEGLIRITEMPSAIPTSMPPLNPTANPSAIPSGLPSAILYNYTTNPLTIAPKTKFFVMQFKKSH